MSELIWVALISSLLTLVVGGLGGYGYYRYQKNKIQKQTRQRVAAVEQGMQFGFHINSIHPVIEDIHQEGNYITLKGVRCLDCRTTSYLKLDMLPEVKEAAKQMIDRYGTARCVTQMYFKLPILNELAGKIEAMTGGLVLIASSVTSGHFAVIPVLVGVSFDSLMVLDRRVHNSVTLATQVCKGNTSIRLNHNDMGQLERILQKNRSLPAVWYFCDGIYSMSGGGAPVAQLVQLMRKYPNLHIYADDAHGTLWYDNAGYFLAELHRAGAKITEFGNRMVVCLALGKCFASGGGAFVFSSQRIRHTVRNCGPTLTFNTIVNPSELGSALHIADMALSGGLQAAQQRLARLIAYRERKLHEHPSVKQGHVVPTDSISPIAFCFFKHSPEVEKVLESWNWFEGFGYGYFASLVVLRLQQTGFLTNISAWPAVPIKEAGVRFAIHSEMTEQDVDQLIEAIVSSAVQVSKEIAAGQLDQVYHDNLRPVLQALELDPARYGLKPKAD